MDNVKSPKHILPTGFCCAEVPYWVEEEGAVYFADTETPRIARYSLADEQLTIFTVPYNFQCLAKCTDGRWIGTVTKGVAIWDQKSGECRFLGNPELENPSIYFNDGTVDPEGRFFFGTYDLDNLEGAGGSVYMVDGDLNIRKIATGFAVCNGMAFSGDGNSFYMSEQFGGRVLGFDWNEKEMKLENRRVVYEIPKDKGLPDGLIMDSEGMLWIAHWWGWRLSRISTDGRLLGEVPMPVTTPTSMVFCGEGLNRLLITTASKAVEAEDLAKGPLAGDIFSLETNLTGRIEHRFIIK